MKTHPRSAPAPAPLRHFLALYAEGRFWDSHEALEDAWRGTGSDFYQGLILYASAWVHWERGNAHGVRAQLAKTLERLAAYPAEYLGIDVAGVREHCVAARRVLEGPATDWQERIAPGPLDFEPGRVRGDEPELRA